MLSNLHRGKEGIQIGMQNYAHLCLVELSKRYRPFDEGALDNRDKSREINTFSRYAILRQILSLPKWDFLLAGGNLPEVLFLLVIIIQRSLIL
jgi:hypothetical protein